MSSDNQRSRLGLLVASGTLGFLICLLIGGALMAIRSRRPAGTIAPTAALITQIQGLNEWVTVKYLVEKVVRLESEPSLLGRDRVILLAHAVVKAGVDLGRLGPEDLTTEGKQVRIRLPAARITDCYLDDKRTEIWEHTTAFWRPLDKELEQSARRQALDQVRAAAGEQGIQREAMERARAQLSLLLKQLGFEHVEFSP